jgi:predicted nucleic-acid-binding protein
MIGVDTNVLLRLLVDDDPSQNLAARTFLSSKNSENPVFVSAVTIAETVWLLTKRLGYPVETVCELLRDMIASDGLIIEHEHQLDQLLRDGARPKTGLADYLIAWSGLSAGCSHTVTFDRRAAKAVPSMELLA